MNAILFVTSLITILALLTYAKIDTFRNFLGMEAKFESYMGTMEHSYANDVYKNWYNQTKAKTSKRGEKEYTRPAATSPRLSFKVLIDPELRAKDPELYAHTLQWAKGLMHVLYSKEPFFQEHLRTNPHLMDEILEGLGRAVEQLPVEQRKKIARAEDLANIDLGPQLKPVYYYMLKGCTREELTKKQKLRPQPKLIVDDTEQDDEDDNIQEASEYIGAKGYNSLLNYITLQNATKVRVYLASRELLKVMTGQDTIANQIIEMRTAFYRTIKNEKTPNEEATEQFQNMVQGYFSGEHKKFLDYTVSKTNPKDYN